MQPGEFSATLLDFTVRVLSYRNELFTDECPETLLEIG